MTSWPEALRAALFSGTAAAAASTLALAVAGRRELNDAAAPINGPSQWIWGQGASYESGFSARYTVLGALTHAGASIFWALFYEKWRSPRHPVASALATAAAANIIDFTVTPERLTPGFQRRLSRTAVGASYAAFALGLLAATLARGQRSLAR
jgi:hypothetical protein